MFLGVVALGAASPLWVAAFASSLVAPVALEATCISAIVAAFAPAAPVAWCGGLVWSAVAARYVVFFLQLRPQPLSLPL
jgi:hypothetical protein